MLQAIKALTITLTLTAFAFSDVFMTEITDPQNSSESGRYVELHNNGSSEVDLSAGWVVQRWTNGNADPTASSVISLTGTIAPGGFYIICNDADKFTATFGSTCDQDIGTGGFADSNGDDNLALLLDGEIVDMFGVAGEDGSGTGHEFEDGRAERAASNITASSVWEEFGWNVDNDSGGGNGPRYAPEDFDPYTWVGSDSGGDDGGSTFCEDENACNLGAEGACEYPVTNYDCDGNCTAELDCLGFCGGSTVLDECGECGGTGASCAEPAANLFFSEHAEGSSNNKYFEVYNASDGDVSLSQYAYVNCSNGCTEWEYTNNFADGATVLAGAVYTVCHTSFAGDLSLCNETRTLYHNGDDAQGLMYLPTSELLDIFGLIGDDPGSGWSVAGVENATKDHTLVRKSSVTIGNTDWAISSGSNADDSEWVVLDQNTWDYLGSHPHNFVSDVMGCMDPDACNYNPDATVDDGTCATVDCAGECGGNALCEVAVTFSVDMSIEGVVGDIKVRTSTENGEYSPSDWFVMSDNGDGTFSHTLSLSMGITYGYNFNNSDGSGYESGSGLGDCAGGNYGNDRYITPGDSDIALDTVCWESCEACPEDIPGCTDESALNYDENATSNDGSCIYEWPETANLFFSEVAEGSSNNKYLEIYNATDADVDLSGYSLSSCSNGCNDGVSWDYPDNVTFDTGTTVASGDVYLVCHGSSDDLILAECDQTFTYLSNGDDVFALTQIGSGTILDIIGTIGEDPGSGWEVAGISNATKDHTLVRDASVSSGNNGNWDESAGDLDSSEWFVLDQNTWTYLGSHPHNFAEICNDENACNAGEEGDCTYAEENYDCDGNCSAELDCLGFCGGSTVIDECGECDGDGSSCLDCCGVANGDDSTCGASGDDDGDGIVAVTDAVSMVDHILGVNQLESCAAHEGDINGDGTVNVLDVIATVDIILAGLGRTASTPANHLEFIQTANGLSYEADGYVGFEITLSHDLDFEINVTKSAFISNYKTVGNTTKLIVVGPKTESLFSSTGSYVIEDVIAGTSAGIEISSVNIVTVPEVFGLSDAYPNPFNPTTSMTLAIPEAGFISVQVYNIMGQAVAMLASGHMDASTYTLTWDASDASSGMYFVKAESAGVATTQKLILMK